MLNIQRTQEVFGYEVSLERKRRSNEEVEATGGIQPKNLKVIDNCPSCGVERQIALRASRKNKICLKCFHSLPEVIDAKRNQKKEKSEETKQKMRDNHWSKNGGISAFKGQQHSEFTKQILRNKTIQQFKDLSPEELLKHRIKSSAGAQGISIEEFNGFVTPENTRIRQSLEGKAWTHDVFVKANFTCDKCSTRGGSLHAHHLNSFNSNPEQRFDIDNGVCLCESCHKKFHQLYNKGNNTKTQYEEFKTR